MCITAIISHKFVKVFVFQFAVVDKGTVRNYHLPLWLRSVIVSMVAIKGTVPPCSSVIQTIRMYNGNLWWQYTINISGTYAGAKRRFDHVWKMTTLHFIDNRSS